MMNGPVIPSRLLRRLLNTPLLLLAIVVVLVDDGFRALVVPAVRAFARLAPVQRIEALIARMPPHAILALFLIPLAIIEPFKVYALYLFGEGHFLSGIMMFVLAKIVGLGLAERLFAIGRDKLLSIGWFARCYSWVIAVRDHVHAWLERQKVWQQARKVVRFVRESLAAARQTLLRRIRGTRQGRLAAARRQVRRYWFA